jgi:hypothetical protein
MTEVSSDGDLTLAVKINRLFQVYRSRKESEQSVEIVARSVSRIIGRTIAAEQINALRLGSAASIDSDVLAGLVEHFGVPTGYLTTTGAEAIHLDTQLRLLAAARDAGVKRLALRGGGSIEAVAKLLESVSGVPQPEM